MKVKKKDIQHEDNQTSLSLMLLYKKDRKDVDYTPDEIKPMQYTTNLILNQNISHLKNAPIQNSDLKPSTIIRPYSKFKGADALPRFKKDLRWWNVV